MTRNGTAASQRIQRCRRLYWWWFQQLSWCMPNKSRKRQHREGQSWNTNIECCLQWGRRNLVGFPLRHLEYLMVFYLLSFQALLPSWSWPEEHSAHHQSFPCLHLSFWQASTCQKNPIESWSKLSKHLWSQGTTSLHWYKHWLYLSLIVICLNKMVILFFIARELSWTMHEKGGELINKFKKECTEG